MSRVLIQSAKNGSAVVARMWNRGSLMLEIGSAQARSARWIAARAIARRLADVPEFERAVLGAADLQHAAPRINAHEIAVAAFHDPAN
jgi:hypothetical protein